MPKKIVKFGSEARKQLQAGVSTVVKAVQTSYGPAGRTSVLSANYGAPNIVDDGVTIAKAIELEGIPQLGVSLIQQAANKTNDAAGDGTTTTTILAGALVFEGLQVVEAGADPVKVRSGIKKATEYTLNNLAKMAVEINSKEDKASVATISSRSKEIGQMIADIMEEIGANGVITVQNGDSNKMEYEITQGMDFDKGYKSPYFVTDTQKMEAVVENPMILVTDKKISSIQDILPVVEEMVQNGKKDLILIAEDIDSEALATLVVNKVRGVFNAYAVQAPAFGERRKAILEDIAILVGASFVNSDLSMDLKNLKMADLGSAKKVIISKDKTVIVGGLGDHNVVNARAEQIKKAIGETKSDYDREKAEERLAKLVGGVAVIKVGASTEVEMKELKYVVEDAVNATKAAVAEGVVPGGASTLVRLSVALNNLKFENEEENMGVKILQKALLKPFRAIAENSGIYDIAIILDQIQKGSKNGFDFKTLTEIEDMFSAGIIDPKKVLREAISNSSSIACSIMTTEVVICDEPKAETPDAGASGMGGMGGMGF